MGHPVFREEVHDERARSALGRIVLIRPLSFFALTVAAVAIATAILSYLFLAEYAKRASLAGTLVPASGTIRVVAPQLGLVRERRVKEGEHVAAGETLLRLVDARATRQDGPVGEATIALLERRTAETHQQREGIRAASRSERESLLGRIEGLSAEMAQLDGELEALDDRGELALLSLRRLEQLELRGFVSPAQRQQKEEESLEHRSRRYVAARTRLAMAREIASLRLAVTESEARSRAQLSALDAQLSSLTQDQVERRAQVDALVTAPAAGIVAALLVEPGQVVAGGASLLTILPDGSPLEAHLYAPSRSIGFIRVGQEVRLRYPAFPYQKFGSHRARVISVSRSAMTATELGFAAPDGSREPLYRIKVSPGAQTVAAYGRAEPLQAGMQVEADVLLDRRRLIEWVFEPLLGLAGRT